MLALSDLLAAASSVPAIPRALGGPDLRSLSGKEYRFAVPSVREIRLPKDVSPLSKVLAAAGPDDGACWAALTAPAQRVPLRSTDEARRAALLAVCVEDGGGYVLAAVTLGVLAAAARHSPPTIDEQTVDVARDREQMLDLIEQVWVDADPAAHAAAGGVAAMWLGGNPGACLPGGDVRVAGVFSTFGLRAEIVRDALRYPRQIATRLGSNPPAYMVVWRPAARGLESVVAAFRAASAEGEVIELDEPVLPDALLELRWALVERGLAEAGVPVEADSARAAPTTGEERFYIKFRNSKAGDVMIEVADCGHHQWGSDVRRLAPRAYKGIIAGVGATPRALFRCSRCSKHRWRARY